MWLCDCVAAWPAAGTKLMSLVTSWLNVTSSEGQTVTLSCNSLLNSDVDWRHQDTPTGPIYYVYTNGVVYDIFRRRYSVDRRSKYGEYWFDLVISRVQLSDAGLYICIDDAGFGDTRYVYRLKVNPGNNTMYSRWIKSRCSRVFVVTNSAIDFLASLSETKRQRSHCDQK